jgi:hypothetical protein
MRGLRSTLILIVILAGLVGYIYYLNREGTDANARERVFAEAPAENIEEVQITLADKEAARVTKSGEAWRLVEPVQADADASELSSITSSLSSLDIQRVVDENATDLKQYGLEPPRMEVSYRLKDEKESRRILVGDKTATGGDLYARLPDSNRVFLISSYLESTFNKDAFGLRDKAVLKFDRDKADGLELTSGSTSIQLAKSGTDWRLVKPIAARADFGQVESIVVRLGSARMESIVEPEAKDLAKYGLDRPTATMAVSTGGDRHTLLLGGTENALVFAKDASRPLVFTVAPTLKDDVIKPIGEYRRKDLFDSRSFTANRVELRRGAETMAFEKSKDGENEVWKNASGQNVDTAKVEDLLSKLTSLRADSFEAGTHASLTSPALSVVVRFDTDKMETVNFGRAGEDVFANRPDEPGSAKVPASSYDEAVKALDAL